MQTSTVVGALVLISLGLVYAQDDCQSCICTREYDPHCGSDGKTYGNKCLLNCARKRCNADLTGTRGECEKKHLLGDDCHDCMCTMEFNPVCGSDGRTYANPCQLQCRQKCNPLLTGTHGACREKRSTENCPNCICTMEWNPQCGSDGKTYGNPCALRCQQKCDPQLTGRQGECPAKHLLGDDCHDCICTMEYNPVCGSDGKTYANPCLLQCKQRCNPLLQKSYHGKCRLGVDCHDCICTMEYNPVCGSDGKTYANRCLLECKQKCNPLLRKVSHGSC